MTDEFTSLQRSKWESLAASFYDAEAPAIPSPNDIDNFRSVLVTAGTVEVGILGCTPSLRDLVNSIDSTPVVLDFSVEVYRASSRYVRLPIHGVFACADWCAVPLKASSLDGVVGDKAIDNVAPKRWGQFFKEMRRVLRPGGVLVLHVGLSDPAFHSLEPASALAKWGDEYSSGACNLASAAAGLWDDLLTSSSRLSAEPILCVGLWQRELTALASLASRGSLGHAEARVLEQFRQTFAGFLDHMWTDCSLELVRSYSAGLFELESTLYSQDYSIAPFQPILVLRRVS